MNRKYKRYTKEFKLEAVNLAESADKPVTEVARELGIRVNQIYKWKKEIEAKTDAAFPGKGRQSGSAAEENQGVRVLEQYDQIILIVFQVL